MSIKQMISDAKVMIGSNYIAMLLYTFIFLAVSFSLGLIAEFFQNPLVAIVIALIVLIFTIPFSVAYLIVLLKVVRGADANPGDLFKETGKQFKMAWKVSLYLLLKILIPLVLMIVGLTMVFYVLIHSLNLGNISPDTVSSMLPNAGGLVLGGLCLVFIGSIWMIIVSIKYTLVYFIKYDEEDLPLKEVFAKSNELMKGSKLSYFFIIFVVQLILILIDKGASQLTANSYALQAISLFFTMVVTPFLSVLAITIYEEKKNETVPTEPAADVEVKIEENN